jgi:hypothetical protein
VVAGFPLFITLQIIVIWAYMVRGRARAVTNRANQQTVAPEPGCKAFPIYTCKLMVF